MLTNVVAIGKIGDPIKPNARYLEVERPHRDTSGKFVTDQLPIMYWSKAVNNYFMTMKKGTLILVKGRLETDEDAGLTLIADHMETLLPVK